MNIFSTYSLQEQNFKKFVKDKDVSVIEFSDFSDPCDFSFPVKNENSEIEMIYCDTIQNIFNADESKVFVLTNIQNTSFETQLALLNIIFYNDIKSNVVFLLEHEAEPFSEHFMLRTIHL